VNPTQLTESCLGTIRVYNPKINAWITVMREQSLAQAEVLGKEQQAGRIRSSLHGIPIGLKDNIDSADVRTTAASAVFEDRVPLEDSEVVR
jgi:aspartyl-tRNA(Asn)/glutamyl-tRNA(Gln) amidotransferase subunit A